MSSQRRTAMLEKLSRALEAVDAELCDAIFDGLLRLIVDYVPFGKS